MNQNKVLLRGCENEYSTEDFVDSFFYEASSKKSPIEIKLKK